MAPRLGYGVGIVLLSRVTNDNHQPDLSDNPPDLSVEMVGVPSVDAGYRHQLYGPHGPEPDGKAHQGGVWAG
jgi:hypothetical protein